ncbi:MAG: response regulator [Betaproteobacteria bacterium]
MTSRPLRILIADDERDTVSTLSELLRLEGHEVRESFNGREALDAEASFAPDVVLLDIGMPQITGYEAARRIRERHGAAGGRGPMLIAITCYQQPSDRILAELVGFDRHLGKPFDPRVLVDIVNREAMRMPKPPRP